MNTFTRSQQQYKNPTISEVAVVLLILALIGTLLGYAFAKASGPDAPPKCEVKRVVGDKHHPFHKICKE